MTQMNADAAQLRYGERPTVNRGGFTLVELLVSIAIFSVVMLIATGSLLSLIEANKKAQALKSVMNNLHFALESMSRSIRVGSNYACAGGAESCPNGSAEFTFISSDLPSLPNKQVTYRFDGINSRIVRTLDGATVAVTAPEVVIEDMKFYLIGGSSSDSIQPKLVMTLRGYAGLTDRVRSEFDLQTTITPRLLDIP